MDIHKITANILKNLNSEEILFLKFSEELGFPDNFLKSYVYRKSDSKKYCIEGLIWKYNSINFENVGNILNNELFIHLKFVNEIETKIDNEETDISVISGNVIINVNPNTYSVLSSNVFSIPNTIGTLSYNTASSIKDGYISEIITKEDMKEIYKNNIKNEKIESEDQYNLYISFDEFINEFYSENIQIPKSIAKKKFQIIAIDA